MKKIADGIALKQSYALYELSGTVQSESTRAETETSGTITGGEDGRQVHGSISSRTTRYQTIYIKEDDDTEHALKLVDFIIPCREGHRLTFLGINHGSWFEVINHTTNLVYKNEGALNGFTYPRDGIFLASLLVGALSFIQFSGIYDFLKFANFQHSQLLDILIFKEISWESVVGGGITSSLIACSTIVLLIMPGKIVSVIRSNQILAAKKRHVNTANSH